MRLKNKNILIFISIGIVLIISMFFVFNKSYEYKELPKVKVKEQNDLKQFALMLEQEDGNYLESEGELPTRGYTFNKKKSGCTDINGKIIDDTLDYNYENNMVTLNTSKTSYCYLYYDIEPNVSYLVSKDENNYISKKLTGGLYRYQGIGDVSNYICYGTNDTEDCVNNPETYMYRIIGVTSTGELKLIKNTWVEDNGTSVFQWHTPDVINSCPNGKCPEWNESNLFYRINGKDVNKTGLSNIFIDNPNYPYLNSAEENNAWYNNILYHDWLYGDIQETEDYYDANKIYDIEKGKANVLWYNCQNECTNINNWHQEEYKWNSSVNAKIGLMYIHDYLYAYKTNEEDAGKPNNEGNAKLSWIYLEKEGTDWSTKAEWTMTRRGIDIFETYQGGFSAWFISFVGSIAFSWNWYGNVNESHYVRPVFYISSNLNINGNGTSIEPFTINFN